MKPTLVSPNRRLLVIDDSLAIHGDFRKILGAPTAADAALAAAEALVFGTPPPTFFAIDTAAQGEEGLHLVERAVADGRPYALAFIDFRMPPGWDGVETTKRIWQVCPELQVVICTAFADCSWDEVLRDLQPRDRLLILKKPFDAIEVRQLANALTEKWRLGQETRAIQDRLEQLVRDRTRALEESEAAALNMMEDAVRSREKAEQTLADLLREGAERQQLAAQFLRSQRMESIGSLAGGIAHDLNNALAPILMASEYLKLINKDSNPETGHVLDTIYDSAKRGAAMVKQILTFARGAEGVRGVVQPKHLIQEMLDITRHSFPKAIEIRTAISPNTWTLLGNPTQLHQILLNLCVNARDALPDGGTLTLGTRNVRLEPSGAGLPAAARPGPYVVLSVQDTGTGMPPEVRQHIFEPFFTTKTLDKGTGLGLSTVHNIVKDHGGFITVDSAVGRGTEFKVYLPAEPDAAATVADAERLAPPVGNGEWILVVDDEAAIRNIATQTLEMFGYQVVTAKDGVEGLVVYQQHRDQLQLVLTDLEMPVMDGPTMIGHLRDLAPHLKIIIASGVDSDTKAIDASRLTCDAYLQKPYSADTLLRTLDTVLHPPATPQPEDGPPAPTPLITNH